MDAPIAMGIIIAPLVQKPIFYNMIQTPHLCAIL